MECKRIPNKLEANSKWRRVEISPAAAAALNGVSECGPVKLWQRWNGQPKAKAKQRATAGIPAASSANADE